jgi:hypothetical protein
MFKLRIPSWSDGPSAPRDWKTVSEEALRYDHFLGDIIIQSEGADFTTTWGWVPVLDFAAGVTDLLHNLQPGCEEVFEFTESEATLTFRREENLVETTASYANGLAIVDYAEMQAVAQSVLSDLAQRLIDRYPDLRFNTAFLRIASLPEL